MLNGVNILKLAYGANILVLVPVVYGMIAGRGVASVFEGQVEDSAGLRLLMARESEIMATMKPGQNLVSAARAAARAEFKADGSQLRRQT